jgi:hypothetical protein
LAIENEYLANLDVRYREAMRLGARNGSGIEFIGRRRPSGLTTFLSIFCLFLLAIIGLFLALLWVGFALR